MPWRRDGCSSTSGWSPAQWAGNEGSLVDVRETPQRSEENRAWLSSPQPSLMTHSPGFYSVIPSVHNQGQGC